MKTKDELNALKDEELEGVNGGRHRRIIPPPCPEIDKGKFYPVDTATADRCPYCHQKINGTKEEIDAHIAACSKKRR